MSALEILDRPAPVRPLFILDVRDHFAEQLANEGRRNPIVVAPFGSVSLELRSVERNGQRAIYRIPVRARQTTASALAVFKAWHAPVAAAKSQPPNLLNSTVGLAISADAYQEATVRLTLDGTAPVVHQVDLLPGVSYPFNTAALPPGIRGVTLVRGAVNLIGASGRRVGIPGVSIVGAPQPSFDFITADSGSWVLAFADAAPGTAGLALTLTARPPALSGLVVAPSTSTSVWGQWRANGDGSFSITGVIEHAITTTLPDLVLTRP